MQLLKRLGESGEIQYDNPSLDSPAAAMGSFVQTLPGGDSDVLTHELEHVKQSDVLGPAFLPMACRPRWSPQPPSERRI